MTQTVSSPMIRPICLPIDSVKALGLDLDNLGKVPTTEGLTFNIKADTASYQMTTVDVVEVGITYADFMEEFF